MKKTIIGIVVVSLWCIGTAAFAETADSKISGEAEFKEHCAICHPDGGNIINPKKTLHKKDREANNIKKEADIVMLMRKPGPGMTPFEDSTVSDKEARAIAAYIIKTFK